MSRPAPIVPAVCAFYSAYARALPWRAPSVTPWGVLVSEVMLQQTPVARVLEPWAAWLERWPVPAALAADSAGAAIRAWGRLGYPRRALRLHQTAVVLAERHGGAVPDDHDALLALPGIGSYTAAAVASFAFGQRHVVLDVNVRRVLARWATGVAEPTAAVTVAERELAASLLPDEPAAAAAWAAASMELGATVCTARAPACGRCPIADGCAWRAAGYPASVVRRRVQEYVGTDRQCRGAMLAVLRDADAPVRRADLAWPVAAQRDRALDTLLADGLIVRVGRAYSLP